MTIATGRPESRPGTQQLQVGMMMGSGNFEPDAMLVFGKTEPEWGGGILPEEEAVFCGADCGGDEAGQGRGSGGGADPEGGAGADDRSLEEAANVGLEIDQARQPETAQEENSRSKQLAAELSLDKTTSQDVRRQKL
jgi:hypothetical protein